MSILYCYPERDGQDFDLGFWLDSDDSEAEQTWERQAAPIARRFTALYDILEENAHYTQKRLDPIVVLNKAFPFRLYVFDNT
ncbi:MAG: hypothetical protein MUE46_10295 [Xanthomonadales bacterium]|jgi:hypothetical protein|nr:hypothetical protein [Xanthomonadales bacterium]